MPGSRKGIPNKITGDYRAWIQKECSRRQINPFLVLMDIVSDPLSPWRYHAAKELAQYLAPKLRAVEHTGDVTHTVRVIDHRYGNGTSPRAIDTVATPL